MGGGRLARAGGDRGRPRARHAAQGHRLPPEAARRVHARRTGSSSRTARSLDYDYLVVATGPELAFDEIEGLGPRATRNPICHVDHAAADARGVRPALRRPGPRHHRRGAGRVVLRARPTSSPSSWRPSCAAQGARQGADDLRDARALYRPSRPRRRGRHQGAARKRDARPAHQVDHQREGRRRSSPARCTSPRSTRTAR